MLTITDTAARRIKKDLAEWAETGDGLRISVYTVGPSLELQYKMDFGPQRDDDHVVELPFEMWVIDPQSIAIVREQGKEIEEVGEWPAAKADHDNQSDRAHDRTGG